LQAFILDKGTEKMNGTKRTAILTILVISLPVYSIFAQQASKQDTLRELIRRIDILTEEIEKAKLGEVAEPNYESVYGMGPAASRVYQLQNPGISFAGYGEIVYNNFAQKKDDDSASNAKNQIDYLRHVMYLGFRFNDWLLFNSEIEFEHGKTAEGSAGSVAIELGYIEAAFSQAFSLRTGMVLIPAGIINEYHEPSTFHGSLRPETERNIIPTTWRAIGVGFLGATTGSFSYKLYLTESLDASGFSAGGIRGGRQNGAKAVAEDFGLSGRFNYAGVSALDIGTSFFVGNTGQGLSDSNGAGIPATLSLVAGHFTYLKRGLELRGLAAYSKISDVARLNSALNKTGINSIGESQFGYYLTVAYNILPLLVQSTTHYLAPFVQYEKLDTQNEVPEGFSKNPANARTNITAGLTYKPHPHVAFKFDHINRKNQAGTAIDQFNLAVNYLF
jgi:hypothetical protein